MVRLVFVFLLFMLPFYVAAKPSNFDECILDNIAATSTEAAVAAITRACRNLFPIAQSPEVPKATLVKKRLKTSQTDWVGNDTFGYTTLRVVVTNNSKIRFKFDEIIMEYRITGCGDNEASSGEVKKIQKALNQRGFDVGRPDGKIGSKTTSAIKSFQASESLLVTGKINSITAELLGVRLAIADQNRFMRFSGFLQDVVYLEPNKTALVDFMGLGDRVPAGDCFQHKIYGETYQ